MTGDVADPDQVHTRDEFGAALRKRLGCQSVRALEEALGHQQLADRRALTAGRLVQVGERAGKTTISEVGNGTRLPTPALLRSLLRLVQATEEEHRQWLSARHRAEDSPQPGPRRVREADPRLLGVHKAIQVVGTHGELPEYVQRDTDTMSRGIRAEISKAAQHGGFVLLVGESSVGKTRCAYEAITVLLPNWWLRHPGPGSDELADLAAAPIPRTLVWLDELQRYLDGRRGLTAHTVRNLIAGPGPVVLVGTLWPGQYATYTTPPRDGAHEDSYRWEREILDLAEVITIDTEWSGVELDRAQKAAERDPRVKQAVSLRGGRLSPPQILAAAPQLEQRWHHANPYAAALLTAAVDATRLGFRSPLPAELLQMAAPGYCDSRRRAAAPMNWFAAALAYATEALHGAAAALESIAGDGMGEILGYTVADYLLQYAAPLRYRNPVPVSLWDALLTHTHDPDDARRLAANAIQRLLLDCGSTLLMRSAPSGGNKFNLPPRLAGLLAERSDANADTVLISAPAISSLRNAQHDDHALRVAKKSAGLLVRRGDIDAAIEILGPLVDAGDRQAGQQLAGLLGRRGDSDAAIEILGPLVDAGNHLAAQLAKLLGRRGDSDAAIEILGPLADAGDRQAAEQLAGLLGRRGDSDAAIEILGPLADAGDRQAGQQLAGLLARLGDTGALAARAEAGDSHAAKRLVLMLARRGDTEALATRAEAGDSHAARKLVQVLARHGDTHALRARADAGDRRAGRRLAGLLSKRGDTAAALEVLRPLADAGDQYAAAQLANLLAKNGDAEALLGEVLVGTEHAADAWLRLLEESEVPADRARAQEVRRVGLVPPPVA